MRCSKLNGATGSSSGSSGAGKERRTSLYAGSNSNPSGPNSHSTDNSVLSPHATSVGTNNIVIANNLNNARPTALVQVLTRTDLNNASTTTTNHNRLHNVSQQGTATVKRFHCAALIFFLIFYLCVSNRQILCSSLQWNIYLFPCTSSLHTAASPFLVLEFIFCFLYFLRKGEHLLPILRFMRILAII